MDLTKIDYNKLKLQKQALLEIINSTESIEYHDHLDGLVHLIDDIQDNAVDNLGFKLEDVFDIAF